MPINAVLDVSEESPLYEAYVEPVTVQEFKDYAKIDTTADDELIGLLITAARENIEKWCGISIVRKLLTITLNNECGGIEIPYGPTDAPVDVTTIVDIQGNAFNESLIEITGTNFLYLNSPAYCYVKLNVVAGYKTLQESLTEGGVPLPQAMKTAIKAQTFYMYEERGNNGEQKGICYAARQLCNKYKRVTELSL